MEKHIYKGETKIDAINKAKKDLVETENNLIINVISETEEETQIEVIEKREILDYIKESIIKLLNEIGYQNINIEITNKDTTPNFTIYSDDDALLIGKNGRNLRALQKIIREKTRKELNENVKFIINVGNYQEKREKSLEHLAFNIAREVRNSGLPVKMDRMNSYERRIIHNTLANDKYVTTHSEGEEPNRYVIVEPKKND